MLSPILERLTDDPDVKAGSGKALDLVTVDTDRHGGLAQEYAVRLSRRSRPSPQVTRLASGHLASYRHRLQGREAREQVRRSHARGQCPELPEHSVDDLCNAKTSIYSLLDVSLGDGSTDVSRCHQARFYH